MLKSKIERSIWNIQGQLNKPSPIWLVRMTNRLKEFEELLLYNTLLKVHNQNLGDKNPKWKEWWQAIQEFTRE